MTTGSELDTTNLKLSFSVLQTSVQIEQWTLFAPMKMIHNDTQITIVNRELGCD